MEASSSSTDHLEEDTVELRARLWTPPTGLENVCYSGKQRHYGQTHILAQRGFYKHTNVPLFPSCSSNDGRVSSVAFLASIISTIISLLGSFESFPSSILRNAKISDAQSCCSTVFVNTSVTPSLCAKRLLVWCRDVDMSRELVRLNEFSALSLC